MTFEGGGEDEGCMIVKSIQKATFFCKTDCTQIAMAYKYFFFSKILYIFDNPVSDHSGQYRMIKKIDRTTYRFFIIIICNCCVFYFHLVQFTTVLNKSCFKNVYKQVVKADEKAIIVQYINTESSMTIDFH